MCVIACRAPRAARADVTERIFFCHFADKREVLFDGEGTLRAILTAGIAEAPATLGPLNTLLRVFRSIEPLLTANRANTSSRQRRLFRNANSPRLQSLRIAWPRH